jgi:hypothetical protein
LRPAGRPVAPTCRVNYRCSCTPASPPVTDEARAALSAADQERLADLIAAYLASRTPEPAFTEDELPEIMRRHDEPFDRFAAEEVMAFCQRVRGLRR